MSAETGAPTTAFGACFGPRPDIRPVVVASAREELLIDVVGLPAPQGSKRPFRNKHTGKIGLAESSERVRPWREAVKHAALDVVCPPFDHGITGDCDGPCGLFDQPLTVVVTFALPRPKGHYGTGRNARLLRDAAPTWPAGKPDVDKLLRSTLDALGEAGVFRDDSQVVWATAIKTYAGFGQPAGAQIRVVVAPSWWPL